MQENPMGISSLWEVTVYWLLTHDKYKYFPDQIKKKVKEKLGILKNKNKSQP